MALNVWSFSSGTDGRDSSNVVLCGFIVRTHTQLFHMEKGCTVPVMQTSNHTGLQIMHNGTVSVVRI